MAVLQIIAIDIMLSRDNALFTVMACRKLPSELQKKGIFWDLACAIGLRVVLILFALQLLTLPYLKIVGALLLLWIGIKIMMPEHYFKHSGINSGATLFPVTKIIIMADTVMSLDKVIAVIGASHGSIVLVTFGILISIQIVVWGSKLLLTFIDGFPALITSGAALLGWIVGWMMLTDSAVPAGGARPGPSVSYVFAASGAALVLIFGKLIGTQRLVQPAH